MHPRKIGIAVILISILASGLFFATNNNTSSNQDNPAPENFANGSSDTVHDSNSDPVKYYNITDVGVNPSSHTLELGETIGFRNNLDAEATIKFDRSNDTISIPSGEKENRYVNGITYFQVTANDYSAKGRINIQ